MDTQTKALFEALEANNVERDGRNCQEQQKIMKGVMNKVDELKNSMTGMQNHLQDQIDKNREEGKKEMVKLLEEYSKSQDKKMEVADKNFNKLSEQVANLASDITKLKIEGPKKTDGGVCPDPWAGFTQNKKARFEERHGHDVLDEATQKKMCKTTVFGWKGNATSEYRKTSLDEFLKGLDGLQGSYEIKAYGRTGRDASIIWETRTQAENFLKNYSGEFSKFCPCGVNGEDRKMKVNGFMTPRDVRKKNATLVYGKILKGMDYFKDEHGMFYNPYKGSVMVKEYEVVKIRCNEEGVVKIINDKRNVQDTEIAGLKEKLEEAQKMFEQKWIH